MPLYEVVCACGRSEVLVRHGTGVTMTCGTCGQNRRRVPSRMSIRVPGPAPLNTTENYARYREISEETLDLGRRMAAEQGEPAGEYGAAVLPKAMASSLLAAHKTFEKGLVDE